MGERRKGRLYDLDTRCPIKQRRAIRLYDVSETKLSSCKISLKQTKNIQLQDVSQLIEKYPVVLFVTLTLTVLF